jgi:glycosyltransferase involved in cell wall biosynthesis
MRVLHVATRANVGGVSRWLDALASCTSLGLSEHHFVVGDVQDGEVEEASVVGEHLARVPNLGRAASISRAPLALIALRTLIRNLEPDVVNTHMAKAGALGRLAARSLGRRGPALVHTMHGHTLSGYFSKPHSRAIAMVERALAQRTDAIGAVGTQVAEDLIAAGIAPASQISVLRPGVPDRAWMTRPQARESLGLGPSLGGAVVAGWLGRLVRIKRPDRLLGATVRVPDVSFIVGGGGPMEADFARRAPGNVISLGWVDPVPFWSACDIAVLTSDNEGIPTALVEASLAGLPAVATRAGSVEDAVVHGITGLVVERNAGAVAEAVRFLADNPQARQRMGRAARERALTEFSPARMWAEHQAMYEKALERRSLRTRD